MVMGDEWGARSRCEIGRLQDRYFSLDLTRIAWGRSSRLGGAQHVVVGALEALIVVPRLQALRHGQGCRSRARATL